MKDTNICNLILQKLKEEERSIAWIARKVGCDKDNLCKMLKNNHDILPDLLFSISETLKEDFFACYSQKLQDRNYHIK